MGTARCSDKRYPGGGRTAGPVPSSTISIHSGLSTPPLVRHTFGGLETLGSDLMEMMLSGQFNEDSVRDPCHLPTLSDDRPRPLFSLPPNVLVAVTVMAGMEAVKAGVLTGVNQRPLPGTMGSSPSAPVPGDCSDNRLGQMIRERTYWCDYRQSIKSRVSLMARYKCELNQSL